MASHRMIDILIGVVLIINLWCAIVMGAGILTAKAFYCRDPDTGKFYPVNSTWSSTTFCGSYTCRLRKLNYSVHKYPFRQFNISDPESNYLPATSKLQPVNSTKGKATSVTHEYNKTNTEYHDVRTNSNPEKSANILFKNQNSSKEIAKEKVTHLKKKIEKIRIQDNNDEFRNAINETRHNATPGHVGDITHKKKFEILHDGPEVVAQKESEKNTLLHKNSKDSELITEIEQLKLSVSKEDDRYLTSDEIKTLTSMLRNVKKSDIEAILEVYNLAQDIYKEIDKSPDHNLIEDLHNIQKKRGDNKPIKHESRDKVSYWYEPKVAQMDTSNLVPVLPPQPKKESHTIPVPPIMIKKQRGEDNSIEGTDKLNDPLSPNYSYFMGPLSNNNFRKLPYYYPMSTIQRHGNYIPSQEYFEQLLNSPVKINYIKPPANTLPGLNADIPVTTKSIIKMPCKQEHFKQTTDDIYTRKTTNNKDKLSFMDNPKALLSPFTHMHKKSPTVLPYPFAYVHYNLSSIPNTYFNLNPWHIFNIKPDEPLHQKTQMTQQPHVIPKYVSQLPNAILINPDLSEEVDIFEQKPVEVLAQEDKMPSWQTPPLSTNLLNEVKANIVGKSKLLPLPIRKKVKLERVSKLIKMDELKRSKRGNLKKEILAGKEVTEEYEVFLEKSTCAIDTEPGFFKMGNLTEPFPACCPQRIR